MKFLLGSEGNRTAINKPDELYSLLFFYDCAKIRITHLRAKG